MRQHSGDTQPPESQGPHPGARGLRLETAQEAGPFRWPTQQCLRPPAAAFSRKPKETSEGRAPPRAPEGLHRSAAASDPVTTVRTTGLGEGE